MFLRFVSLVIYLLLILVLIPVPVFICILFLLASILFSSCFTVRFSQMFQVVVPLTDLLAQFNDLHLCWHVSHGPHTLPQVLTLDVALFVPVELLKRLTEL